MLDKQKLYDKYVTIFTEKQCKLLSSFEEFKNIYSIHEENTSVKYLTTCNHENNILLKTFRYTKLGLICKNCKLYNTYKQVLIDKDCSLITSLDEFNKLLKITKVPRTISIKYQSTCGHQNSIKIGTIRRKCAIDLCKECTNIKNHTSNEDGSSTKTSIEDIGIIYIKEILNANFDLKLMDDGCLADFCIKEKKSKENKWLKIQLKTTNNVSYNQSYIYSTQSKYTDCVILCMYLQDKKIWLFNGNDINEKQLKITQTGKYKYSSFLTNEKIINKLIEYMRILPLFTFNEINIPVHISGQKEQEFRKHRENKCNFLDFEYTERTALVYDFIVNNFKIQEKVIQCVYKNKCFRSDLRKNGKKTIYEKGDNDFYWLHFPDKIIFMILPEKTLIDQGYIKTESQRGKNCISISIKKISSKTHIWNKYLFNYNSLDETNIKKLFSL